MLASNNVRRLAEAMAEARPGDSFLLLLGSGFAEAAQVPGVEQVACGVFAGLFAGDPVAASSFLSEEDWEQIQQAEQSEDTRRALLEAFYKYVSSLSGRLARRSVFWSFYDGLPILQCYQDVARLTKDGYFHDVLTTNVDTFLEGALDAVGLSEGDGYYVVDLVVDPECERCPPSGGDGVVSIVKLHSGLGPSELTGSFDEIRSFLKPERAVLAAGYEFENQWVNDWLAESDGVLWWASPKHPASEGLALLENWDVRYVGEPGDVNLAKFFGLLGTELAAVKSLTYISHKKQGQLGVKSLDLRADGDVSTRPPPRFPGSTVSKVVPTTSIEPETTQLSQDNVLPSGVPALGKAKSILMQTSDLEESRRKTRRKNPKLPAKAQWEAEVRDSEPPIAEIKITRVLLEQAKPLQDLLAQSREILARLQQQKLVRGESDLQLRVQIAYQRDQITRLERQLLLLKEPVVALMRAVETAVGTADTEPEVQSFVQSLLSAVESEYGRPEPNQDVLSAAISATVLLAQRLGKKVVDPLLVRELTAFIPGAESRRL